MPSSAAMSNPFSSRDDDPTKNPHSHHAHALGGDDDDDDELDFLDADDGPRDILGDDPLRDDPAEPLSFKRKQKQSSFFSQPARLFSALTGGANSSSNAPPSRFFRPSSPRRSPPPDARPLDALGRTSKDDLPLDWNVEGPGRRVGYEDLTAIDWIFEYTKERQRLRMLTLNASGLLGYVKQFLDASQVWVVLVLTGLAVGALAAGIDVATDWLGDIKYGYCSREDGAAFYVSKTSCCIGYDEAAKCFGWKPWGAAFGISSAGGRWFVEYIIYLVLAVSSARVDVGLWLLTDRCR